MSPDFVTASDLFHLLWRRKFVVLLSGLITGLIALGVAASLPPHFAADGLLLIEAREPQIPELNVLAAAPPANSQLNRTELDVLRSRALIESVVRQLDLADDPAFAPAPSRIRNAVGVVACRAAKLIGGSIGERLADMFPPTAAPPSWSERTAATVELVQKNLQVTHEDNSGVVAVHFVAGSPTAAAAVVNALFDQYIANEEAARRAVMLQTHQWLSERAAALQPEVAAADRAVQQFRNDNPTFELAQGSLIAIELNNEETELSAAQQDLLRRQSALEVARGNGFKEALDSPLIQQLRSREEDAGQRMAYIGQRLGTQHPDYLAAANSLNEARRAIQAATAEVVATMQQGLADAAKHVADLEARVATSRARAARSTVTASALSELTREADAKRRVYETFMTRAAETEPTTARFPSARVISPSVVPQRPDRLPMQVVGLFGALAGAFAASGVSILGFLRRQGIGSVRELVAATNLPCLGALPVLRTRGAATQMLYDNHDGAVETLRAMRFAIQAIASPQTEDAVTVLVTSSEIGDGKTTLAASFARLCATDGQRVLLVEADLRRPRLARTLGVKATRDLEAALSGRAPLADTVMVAVDPRSGLHCLTTPGRSGNPQKLFRSSEFSILLKRARRDYDLVVLDSPPVLRVADPLLIAGLCDVILFAVRWDRTPRRLVAEGVRRIPQALSGRMATVLTGVPEAQLDRTDYYAGYDTTPVRRPRALALLPSKRKSSSEEFIDGDLT